jgi:hypothetical protein
MWSDLNGVNVNVKGMTASLPPVQQVVNEVFRLVFVAEV